MRSLAVVATLTVLGLPSAAAGERGSAAAPEKSAPRTVLALEATGRHDTLLRVDGRTLGRLRGRRVALDGHVGEWAFSPDRRKIAFGIGDALGLSLVDARKMRRLGFATLANGAVSVLTWPTENRIVGVEDVAGLFVVDPARRRLVRSQRLDGSVYGARRADSSLVLLLAPEREIGAARLVVVDPEGATRSVILDRISAGSSVSHEEPSPETRGEFRDPGLAVDGTGQRAFVVGTSGEPIAEVDLAELTVSYRSPAAGRSLLGRLHDWLEPAAAAKVPLAGSYRSAGWLGADRLAVSGGEVVVGEDGRTMTVPAGLSVVDTTDWSLHVLDPHAGAFLAVEGMLLTSGKRAGLVGYTPAGARRYEIFAGRDVWILDVLGSRVFAVAGRREIYVVDALTGRVVGKRSTMRRLVVDDRERS